MKTILQSINEAELSSWGVGTVNDYVRRIKKMLTAYGEKEAANKAKVEKRNAKTKSPFGAWTDIKNLEFKAYPIAIAIEELGYKADKVFQRARKPNYDFTAYTHWIAKKINDGDVTIEDLAKWWYNADAKVAKATWFDYKKIIKDIDPEKMWDPYYPDSTAIIDKIRKEPFAIVWCLKDETKFKSWKLSTNEREELCNFLADPGNVAMVNKLIDKLMPKLETVRPTVSSAIRKYFADLFSDTRHFEFKGSGFGNTDDIFKKKERGAWYAGEENFENCMGKAIQNIVTQTYKHAFPKEDDLLNAFQSGEKIRITNLGNSKRESGDVHNSSFWSEYKNDFKVELFIYPNTKDIDNSKPDYEETFEGVTTATSYFSGGWN